MFAGNRGLVWHQKLATNQRKNQVLNHNYPQDNTGITPLCFCGGLRFFCAHLCHVSVTVAFSQTFSNVIIRRHHNHICGAHLKTPIKLRPPRFASTPTPKPEIDFLTTSSPRNPEERYGRSKFNSVSTSFSTNGTRRLDMGVWPMPMRDRTKCAVPKCPNHLSGPSNLCDLHQVPGVIVQGDESSMVVTLWLVQHDQEQGIVLLNDFALGDRFSGPEGFLATLQQQGFTHVRNLPGKEDAEAAAKRMKLACWSGPWQTRYPLAAKRAFGLGRSSFH